ADLRYEGTMHRRGAGVPDVCYFILGFITSSLAGEMVVRGATWFLEKLDKLVDRVTLRINGRKTEISKEAISETIELALSEPSIEDQIQNILSEIEQLSQTIIPLAHKSRLHTEEFYKGFPCARLWAAHRFYSTIMDTIEPKLEEIKRLENFCIGPIAISEPKENTGSQEPKS
ncbi:MAG: hypothetical protein U9Q76_03930, partial [candidate division WOR-3 bacterium]|nr:hypothetical protein [candidate division WOR-3 bacterium]